MEKKELQKLFRDFMKAQGFKSKGNLCTKYLAEDYLVFAALEHSSYGPEYGIQYGVLYEADQREMPFNGMGADWSEYFDWGPSWRAADRPVASITKNAPRRIFCGAWI